VDISEFRPAVDGEFFAFALAAHTAAVAAGDLSVAHEQRDLVEATRSGTCQACRMSEGLV
jgi:hypothetical protein